MMLKDHIVTEADGVAVSAIEVASVGAHDVVVLTKNNCVLVIIIKLDPFQIIGQRFVVLPALQISGIHTISFYF